LKFRQTGHLHHIRKAKAVKPSLIYYQFELVAHTHPDWDRITPSQNDRSFLKGIGQKNSMIISSITGQMLTFGSSLFEDI